MTELQNSLQEAAVFKELDSGTELGSVAGPASWTQAEEFECLLAHLASKL